ncbi:MAG TPA: tRNA preQ1(34) S-adenosylmethionine ribosyltransferase-isomerase QueA [bacterium]|nr:tRNA preQ1(34) S-adenosylmethionine ribosyltransferase-isomerase QueA [bacterium]
MKLSDFDYNLPLGLIAQKPSQPRDHSRLLIYNRITKKIEHKKFFNIIDYLKPDDVLFINNSKVFSARLIAKKNTGGQVEIFLLKNLDKKKNIWQCLIKGHVKIGLDLFLSSKIQAHIISMADGIANISFNENYLKFIKDLNKIGQVPLPPYIKRNKKNKADIKNYQTVYAQDNKLGSVAAPTAGLHFTTKLLKKIKGYGIKIIAGTLHVGLGTFKPIKTENILDHHMHSEDIEMTALAINNIIKAKNRGQRIIAVGTTSARILESLVTFLKINKLTGKYEKYQGPTLKFSTDIFIYPGYQFKIVDALITNFHLPKSSLILLISALIGLEQTKFIYNLAVKKKYRFFSYGDAMLIV